MTTGVGREGGTGQHIVATSSSDHGKTWSPLGDVEPAHGAEKSSYALALMTPFDRIYAFYCYNGDAIKALPNGKPIRDDMQGWCCYRYSDDKGKTWAKRFRAPMRVTAVDRANDWQGKLQMFWAIGTPSSFNGAAMFGFTKLGKHLLQDGEGWFFRSDNILTERDPEKIQWRMLPDGDHGVRAMELGSVQEEHDLVHLGGDNLFCVYRTARGHAACSHSKDGGRTWEKPGPLAYTPLGRSVKQPRACTKIWKTKNGRYLLWFHNNSTTTYNNGPNAGSRNIAWLSAGTLQDGCLHWSQPEIASYVDGGLEGCSYPDFIEVDGKSFLCATQKTEARVMAVDAELLQGLWNQGTNRTVTRRSLVVDRSETECINQTVMQAPRLPLLSGTIRERSLPRDGRGGFTVELTVRFSDVDAGQIVLDGRDAIGKGILLRTTDRATFRFEMSDGWTATFWDCDAGLLKANVNHHLAVIVDGGPKSICFIVDGQLCDGSKERPFGFGRFNANCKDVNGERTWQVAANLHGRISRLRVYARALRTSEIVGNFRALQRTLE